MFPLPSQRSSRRCPDRAEAAFHRVRRPVPVPPAPSQWRFLTNRLACHLPLLLPPARAPSVRRVRRLPLPDERYEIRLQDLRPQKDSLLVCMSCTFAVIFSLTTLLLF